MNTFLGASSHLSPPDVDEALVRAARIVYLEGYMWDRPAAKSAFLKAGEIARAANRRVALTLSDSFCVDRFRGEFIDLMRRGIVDTLFANTDEILSLYETPSLEEALAAVRREGVLAAVTRSEKGSVVVDRRHTYEVAGVPDRAAHRHHRRRRSLRRRLPRRPGARRGSQDLRGARRARRRRDHPASRRAARSAAGVAGARQRPRGLSAARASRRRGARG